MREGKDYQHIKGWGIDADPKNEPTYPMKTYNGDDHRRLAWERPVLQQTAQEILVSVERPSPSAVVGETVAPTGLSGMLRRYAFKSSESEFSHWIPLLLADRVDAWEGILEDVRRGRLPNFFLEKGGAAAWKHDRMSIIKRGVLTVASLGLLIGCLCLKRKKAC